MGERREHNRRHLALALVHRADVERAALVCGDEQRLHQHLRHVLTGDGALALMSGGSEVREGRGSVEEVSGSEVSR